MPYPIENKLVIAVASGALFNLIESDSVFKMQGESVYREYQEKHLDTPFEKGVAFSVSVKGERHFCCCFVMNIHATFGRVRGGLGA